MADTYSYDDSPERRSEPVGRAELDELARSGAQLAARPAHVRHLIARMQATLEARDREKEHLRSELARAKESAGSVTSTDTALKALSGMSSEDRDRVLGAHMAREAARLESVRRDAEMEVVAGRSLLARILRSAEKTASTEGPEAETLIRRVLKGAGVAISQPGPAS